MCCALNVSHFDRRGKEQNPETSDANGLVRRAGVMQIDGARQRSRFGQAGPGTKSITRPAGTDREFSHGDGCFEKANWNEMVLLAGVATQNWVSDKYQSTDIGRGQCESPSSA